MDPELNKICKDHNPWYDAVWESPEKILILKDDYPHIRQHNERNLTDVEYIQTGIYPQPYIGNPEAPIWILTMNPSYSAMDVYDMVRCDDSAKRDVIEEIGGESKALSEDMKTIFRDGSDTKEALERRQELILRQQKFESCDFYVLDDAFRTINKHKGSAALGAYEWWDKFLCRQEFCRGDKEKVAKFFVLEFFPYHSKKYNIQEKTAKCMKHHAFWKEMVEYAIKKEKKLLVRGENTLRMLKQLPCDKKNIFLPVNSQRFYISPGNFYAYEAIENAAKAIRALLP